MSSKETPWKGQDQILSAKTSSYYLLGVMIGPLKFLTARKILPLLDLLAKCKRVLACSCSPNVCLARSSESKFFISARADKKIAVLGMLTNARKDHSSPPISWNDVKIYFPLIKKTKRKGLESQPRNSLMRLVLQGSLILGFLRSCRNIKWKRTVGF